MSLNEGPARILVVDGDEGARRVVGFILRREGYDVLVEASGKEALARAVGSTPDLVLLDATLPDLGGLLVCEELRSWYDGPVMMLSGNGDEDFVIQALNSGADDCMMKPIRPAELLVRVRALLRRYRMGSRRPVVIEVGDLQVNLAKRRVFRRGLEIRFPRTEFDILVCLAQNQDRVVTSKMILDKVWGPSHGEYVQTLRVHVGHLRRKLELNPSSPRYIMTEPGVGYRFAVPSPAVAMSL